MKVALPPVGDAKKPAVHRVSMKHVTNAVRTSARIVRLLAMSVTKPSVTIVKRTRVNTVVLRCVVPVGVNTTVY